MKIVFWIFAGVSLLPMLVAQCTNGNLTFTNQTLASGTYQATGTITADSGGGTTTVPSGASVAFQAGTSIVLLPDFHAAAGGSFTASIASCSPGPGQSYTVTTSPSGLSIAVDAVQYTAPQAFQWTAGSMHTIAAATQGTGNSQYLFASWSDGGGATHTITAGSTGTYTATFTAQYLLTTSAATAGGTISPGGWYNVGGVAPVSATPNSGYQFATFFGALSGATDPQNLIMSAPETVGLSLSRRPRPRSQRRVRSRLTWGRSRSTFTIRAPQRKRT